MHTQALLIFVRKPEWGKVKTRLAADVGNDMALDIYQKLLQYTQDITSTADADRFVFATAPLHHAWPDTDMRVQGEGDLGARMTKAFEEIFAEGYRKVMIIGSDCASLTPAHLSRAFAALDTHDLVIGPAADGGYYLLGMTAFFPALFQEIHWSTDTVLSATLSRAEALSLRVHLLDTLTDIDEYKDLPEDWR